MTKKNQAGIGLLEALIAVALSSIIILGALYSTARIFVAQKDKNIQYMVVNNLRYKLENVTIEEKKLWCQKTNPVIPSIPNPQQTGVIAIKVICESMKVSIINSNATYNKTMDSAIQPTKLEVDDASLGGKITVGELLK